MTTACFRDDNSRSSRKEVLTLIINLVQSINQSVIFIVAKVAAATARTTKSVTVTQLVNSTVQHLGRTAGTDNVSVGAKKSTANQPARCRQANCSRVWQHDA